MLMGCWFTINAWMRGCIKNFNEQERKYDNEVKAILEKFLENEFEGFGYLSLQYIKEMLQFIKIMDEIYRTFINYIADNPGNYTSECHNENYISFINYQHNKLQDLHRTASSVYIFQKYFENVVAAIVFISGLLMTGIMVLIFIKHKEMRSEQNMIVMNIATCDFIGITVLYPMQHLIYNYSFF